MLRLPADFGTFVRLAPWLVLAACMAMTLVGWNTEREKETRVARLEFDVEVKEVHARIDEHLRDYREILRGVAGLFAASGSAGRRQFHIYIDKLRLDKTYPGIQGVGYARLILAREKQSVVAAIRREGFPQFDIRPPGVRDPYSAIIYLEPFDWRNQRAFGYDMYSEPVRRAAMERARDTDAPAISGKVVLVQETEKESQSGFLMYVPIYRNVLPHETVEERRSNLLGWAYEPFRMNDLMSKGVLGRFLDTVRNELDIEIYDGDSPEASSLMFDANPVLLKNGARFVSTHTGQYFGRNWTIVVHSLPAFEARVQTGRSRVIAIGGGIISLLLTLIVWLLSTTNTRAVRLAKQMSEKLEQTLIQTIDAMAAVIEMRDPYTAGHQHRAADLARAIAAEMGLNDEQLHVLYLAALVHDIGNIQIPAEILSKPGALDRIEHAVIRTHAQAGFDILSEIDFPWPIARIVQQHHERLDGSGYPLGLKGKDILIEARIIAVAEVVEAMCSHRPYRPARGMDAALSEITAGRGTLFDPAVVDACVTLFRERGYQFPGWKRKE